MKKNSFTLFIYGPKIQSIHNTNQPPFSSVHFPFFAYSNKYQKNMPLTNTKHFQNQKCEKHLQPKCTEVSSVIVFQLTLQTHTKKK